jgi:nicotinamide-nucleotide amidase
MNAAIITIGDELLNGQTIDTNSSWLAQELNLLGINIALKFSCGDSQEPVRDALQLSSERADLIITTGGLGPTKDDITKKSICDFLSDELRFDQGTYDNILALLKSRGRGMTELHKNQCYMPGSAKLIANSQGTAPGMWMEHEGKIYLALPGVPREMKAIMKPLGLGMIANRFSGEYIIHSFIQTAGCGETIISEAIQPIVDRFPASLSIAYLPSIASVKLRITAKGKDFDILQTWVKKFTDEISFEIKEHVYGFGELTLSEAVGQLCLRYKIKLATAESCTGGLLAQLITSISGASSYYQGSIVAYSNELKMNLLRVPDDLLALQGAVSEAVVKQMVRGAIAATNADVAIATSGIAGPTGGSIDKPVGTIWIAVGTRETQETVKLQLNKDRIGNVQYTAVTALNMMRKFIEKNFA